MAGTPGKTDRFRAVGQVVLAVAVVRVVADYLVSEDQRAGPDQLLASTLLLIAHGIVYLFGARMRAGSGPIGYFGVQITLAGGIALFSQSLFLAVALFGTVAAQAVMLVLQRSRRRT